MSWFKVVAVVMVFGQLANLGSLGSQTALAQSHSFKNPFKWFFKKNVQRPKSEQEPQLKSCLSKESQKEGQRKSVSFFNEVLVKSFDKEQWGQEHFKRLASTKKDMDHWDLDQHLPKKEKKSTTSKLQWEDILKKAQDLEATAEQSLRELPPLDIVEADKKKEVSDKLRSILHKYHGAAKKYYKFYKLHELQLEKYPEKDQAQENLRQAIDMSRSNMLEISYKIFNYALKLLQLADDTKNLSYGQTMAFKSSYRLFYMGIIDEATYQQKQRQIQESFRNKAQSVREEFIGRP